MKNGYTLAEVLITLAIVGVVAALALPALFRNIGSVTIGEGLARGVELVQQGTTNIKMEAQNNSDEGTAFENLASIRKSDIGLDGDNYITDDNSFYNDTKSFFAMEDVTYDVGSVKGYDDSDVNENLVSNFTAYKFNKVNVVVAFQNVTNDNIANAENDDIISRVLIDANGTAAPNRFGKDVFLFGLTNDGRLIPAGTNKYHDFDGNVAVGACDGDDIGNGIACAARVASDKWEVKY